MPEGLAPPPGPDSPRLSPPLRRGERLSVLEMYHALDADAEQTLEDILEVAARVCETPLAFISFRDREQEQQGIVARIGLRQVVDQRPDAPWADEFANEEPVVIPDLRDDPRFRDDPRVAGAEGLRFYASVPILSPDGEFIGTLSVFDTRPRGLDPSAQDGLDSLARLVTRELELRRSADLLADLLDRTRLLADVIPVCHDCGRVRNGQDDWEKLETYLAREVGTLLSHGVCPSCAREHYPLLEDDLRVESM